MRQLYSAVLYVILPLVLVRLLWRSRREPGYRERLRERFGAVEPDAAPGAGVLWVHAVSVGEVAAAAGLVEQLLEDYPAHRIVLTTATPAGAARARALFGARVFHCYAPWDLPGAVRRFLTRVRPRLLLLMETELWPNLLHECRARGCLVVLANARLSARSARRYARVGGLVRQALANLDRAVCQSPDDGRRLVALGLAPEALSVSGNLKFDLTLDDALLDEARTLCATLGLGGRPVLVAASTHPGEEAWLLAAFATVRTRVPDCLLLLAPRQPRRFDEVYALCRERGWRTLRRSAGKPVCGAEDILLLDSVGELALVYSAATVAFVGGSLVPHGGHNLVEPAAWGVPVVAGPHLFNFAGASDLLLRAGAMLRVGSPQDLGPCLARLLTDAACRDRMGRAGRQVVADNRGAKARLRECVAQVLAGA